MPTINQLSAVNSVSGGDQVPIYAPSSGDARKASMNTIMDFVNENVDIPAVTAQDVSFIPSGILSSTNVQDAIIEQMNEASATTTANRRVNRQSQNCQIIFDGYNLAQFTAGGANAGGGSITTATSSTIAEAFDVSNGYAGGSMITFTQNTTDGTKNILKTPYLEIRSQTHLVPYFFTFEMSMASSRWGVIDLCNETPASIVQIQVGLPNNQIKVTPFAGTTLTVSPAGFDQTKQFRILCAIIPTTTSTGNIYTYLYHSTGRSFIGLTTYSATSVFPTRLWFTQQWTASGPIMTVARPIIARISGVTMGCSIEAGYDGWNMAPSIPRDSLIYDIQRNPANLIAARFNGADRPSMSNEWWINQAMGGFTVAQMLGDLSNWVLVLKPKQAFVGSATNSVLAALVSADPTAYMTQAKADYLSMVNQLLAAGARVCACGITPRNDTGAISVGLANVAALSKDFNAWGTATLPPLGVPFVDPYTIFEDPSNPYHLNPIYAAPDNVHFSKEGQWKMADICYETWAATA